MSSVKSYPHYEINVKDNSIYNFAVDEILPVHRAVWVLPTEKGPSGQPIWVRNKTEFDRIFGKQTLELYKKKYTSPACYWLRNLLTMNGQFIVRALPETADRAVIVLWAKVEDNNGVKLMKKTKSDGTTYFQTVQADITERLSSNTASLSDTYATADYGKYAITPKSVSVIKRDSYTDPNSGKVYVKNTSISEQGVAGEGVWEGDGPHPADDELVNYILETRYIHEITPETEAGLKITFFTKEDTDGKIRAKIDAGEDIDETAFNSQEGEYPLLVVAANYKGNYGNDYAFRFFSNPSDNNSAHVAWHKSIFNSFAAYHREPDSTTTTAIEDAYGRTYVNFAADPDAIDTETAVSLSMETSLESSYDTNTETSEEFPFIIYSFEQNLKLIGEKIIAIEKDDPEALGITDLNYATLAEFIEDFGGSVDSTGNISEYGKAGYAIDVLGGVNPSGKPYPKVKYANGEGMKTTPFYIVAGANLSTQIMSGEYAVCSEEEDVLGTEDKHVVRLDRNTDIFLSGGSDGVGIWNSDNTVNTSFLDKAMNDFVTLKTNKTIVDKFRYPFTHIYDIGYSMTTKYAMIDFLNIRDDVMVELTTQALLSNEWAYPVPKYIKLNEMYDDITAGLALREYALLQRESILYNTDTMRVAIYPQAGRPVSVSLLSISGVSTNYDPQEATPFLYWSAYQHAKYGNRPYMSIQEPRGLPYSYNNLFKDWNWVPHYENQKERTWNTGLNYCQYADMSRIFYPALRTVYRHDTSILSDQWDVDALIYTKHECRKAWAHFVGRNDRVAELQEAIKRYLEEKLAYLYSGKFDFEVTVYQTEEEQKIGYIQHVKLKITFPATLRVLIFDIEVNREGYTPEA